MNNRIEALDALLNIRKPLTEISEVLIQFPWNNEELLVLEVPQIRRVLEQYLSGVISESFVEDWANLIECRDDISFDKKNNTFIKELMHTLANPYLTRRLTHNRAKFLIRDIDEANIN
jgi:hypothetical protein